MYILPVNSYPNHAPRMILPSYSLILVILGMASSFITTVRQYPDLVPLAIDIYKLHLFRRPFPAKIKKDERGFQNLFLVVSAQFSHDSPSNITSPVPVIRT